MRRSTFGVAAIVSVGLAISLLSLSVGAQSPAPPSLPLPTNAPTPTPDSGIEWPPARFEGPTLYGDYTFTSDCGVWGRDPITLHGEGGGNTFELVVTFDTYDAEDFRWSGRMTGTHTIPDGRSFPMDEPASITFRDGQWRLKTSYADEVVAHACVPVSPAPSGGAG